MPRIIQWATGNVGKASLRAIIETPDFDLVGLYVYSADKVGVDAGDLVGLGKTGVLASNDMDAMLALDADCVVFNGLGDTKDPAESEATICRILASGKNVVSTAVARHVHRDAMPKASRERIEAACRQGNATFFSSGINPGYTAEMLPIAISGVADRIEHVHCIELVDMAHYTSGQIVHDAIGMGRPAEFRTPLENDGPVEENAYYTSALVIAEAFGLTFDEVVRSTEKALAPRDIAVPWGVVGKGTIAGLRMRLRGFIGGTARFTSDMVWKVTDDVPDDWPTGDSTWLVNIEGDPAINCRFDMESKTGRTISHVTSMAAFNRIRDAIAAEPGIKTQLDFPIRSGGRIAGRG